MAFLHKLFLSCACLLVIWKLPFMARSCKLLVFVYLSILGTALYDTFIQTACLCVSQHSGDCLIWHFHTNCLSLCISAFWGLPYMALSYKLLVSVYLSILGTALYGTFIQTACLCVSQHSGGHSAKRQISWPGNSMIRTMILLVSPGITKYNGHDDSEYT